MRRNVYMCTITSLFNSINRNTALRKKFINSLIISRKMTANDPMTVKMLPTAIVLNEANVSSSSVMKERKLLYNPNLWHKIIIQNCENYRRDYLLKVVLDDVHPLDLIPIYFTVEGSNASFFARNCRMAIDKLWRQNLVIGNPQDPDKPFKLIIIMAYSNVTEFRINVQKNITEVLSKRYSGMSSKILNLDNFSRDPDLTEYCTLSQPKILYFVLHISKQFQIQTLKLSNNDIRILSPIESIWGMKSLTTLDLRNNMIEDMSELNILKTKHITELYLDGNPVCEQYDDYSYVQAVKEVCPKIEKLDGVLLGQNGFLAFRRNYLCNMQGQELVDQFLEHYFTLYDNGPRAALEGLYHKSAMLSITCVYLPGQVTTSTASLGVYKCLSRNLRLLSDLARSEECLQQGPAKIIKTISSLPATIHYPYTFTVDLVYYTADTAIVTVTGVFRENIKSQVETARILGFTRTFVLLAAPNGEYNIVNEQFHVSNATTAQMQRAFKIGRLPKERNLTVQSAHGAKEKEEMVQAFRTISTMNTEWCKKCLEECAYDLQKSMMLFVELYKLDKIPDSAF